MKNFPKCDIWKGYTKKKSFMRKVIKFEYFIKLNVIIELTGNNKVVIILFYV